MRAFLKHLTLVLTSLTLASLCLEVGLRLADRIPVFSFNNLLLERVNRHKNNVVAQYDPLLGWVPVANYSSRVQDRTVTFGDQGVRMNNDKFTPLPTGAIMAVGDSFTAGSEVSDDETWPAHLQQILGRPVVNAASGGWGTDQMIMRAETLLPVLVPKMVIVGVMVDDILRAQFEFRGGAYKPLFVIEDGKLVNKNYPVPKYTGSRYELGLARVILGHSRLVNWTMEAVGYTEWWSKWDITYRWGHHYGDKVTCLLLDRLKKRLDADNASLVLLFEYGSSHLQGWKEPPDHQKNVKDCAHDMSITIVDAWGPLKEMHENDKPTFCALYVQHDGCRVLGHMSSLGNRFVATLIAQALAR